MDELLKRVAELKGMPASLVERSAQARAEKTGTTLEEVLKDWAGEADEPAKASEADEAESQEQQATTEPKIAESDAPSSGDSTAPSEITTDYLVGLAADAKRMPPKLIRSSAGARAEHSGSTVDQVLALWAGVDLEELRSKGPAPAEPKAVEKDKPAEQAAEPAPQEPATAVAAGEVVAVPAGAVTVDELLATVAEIRGMPGVLIKRSANARAKETGDSLEAVLAEWAGVDLATVAASTAAAAEESAPAVAAEATGEDQSESAPVPAEVEVIEASAADADAEVEESPDESEQFMSSSRYPKWLAAAFVLIPLLGVGYILSAPNGPDCGTAGQLLVDPQSGEAVSCDGSDYPSTATNFFADGEKIYVQCAACHAANGTGGVGPAFAGGAVLATFPEGSCGDHIEWVGLGTAKWPESTYGATGKTVGGGGNMPGFGTQLSEEQIASVVLYERVAFGGQDLESAEIDCGFVGDGSSVEASGG